MPPEVVPSQESPRIQKSPFYDFQSFPLKQSSRVSAPLMLHRTDLYFSLYGVQMAPRKKDFFDIPEKNPQLQLLTNLKFVRVSKWLPMLIVQPQLSISSLWWSLDTENKESSDIFVPGPQLQSLTFFWASRMRSEPSFSIWWTSGTQKDGLGVLEMGL